MGTHMAPIDFASWPTLGWENVPSPITALPELASELGLSSLRIKRDDLFHALLGGTKPRKLNFLLAQERFAQAQKWHGVGAIGSGQLAALYQAAATYQKKLDVHCSHLAFCLSLSASVRPGKLNVLRVLE